MATLPNLQTVLTAPEDQWFERKSIRTEARALGDALIGFANADGGQVVVGVHNGGVEGTDAHPDQVNSLRQAALDFTVPPVRHTVHLLDCVNRQGQQDHLLVFDVEPSEQKHRNRRNECFLRVGDENRRLSFEEERELTFDKGEANFDRSIAEGLTLDDLDLDALAGYVAKLGAEDLESVARSRGILVQAQDRLVVTQAGWLLFGKYPPIWSYVRYLRYEGNTAETGTRSNLTEDIRVEGPLPRLIEDAKTLLGERLQGTIRLMPSGRFERAALLPEFVWLEAVVNAVTHRSYSIQGDGIRVIEFSDRLEVESPGRLPGLVRVQNIRTSRFARNPHIGRVLAELTGYVRELNEGVRRMYEDMERNGLPAPVYKASETGVRVVLYKRPEAVLVGDEQAALRNLVRQPRIRMLLGHLLQNPSTATRDVISLLSVTPRTARRYLSLLRDAGLLQNISTSPSDPSGRWEVVQPEVWSQVEQLLATSHDGG